MFQPILTHFSLSSHIKALHSTLVATLEPFSIYIAYDNPAPPPPRPALSTLFSGRGPSLVGPLPGG